MSFLAKLTIDDQEFNVLSFTLDVNQPANQGRSFGYPRINNLHITIEASENSFIFFSWCTTIQDKKDGKIVFYKRDAMASSRTLEFTGGVCVNYNDTFQNDNAYPMITTLEISLESLEFNGTVFRNFSAIDQ